MAQVLELTQREKHFSSKEKILGQFLTPGEIAEFIVSFAKLCLPDGKSACDPACGDGIFLDRLVQHGFAHVTGIDADPSVLSAVSPHVKRCTQIIIEDALKKFQTLESRARDRHKVKFDVVVGNPPYSSKYGRVASKATLSSYFLGRGRKSQAIEALFLERFIELSKPGGFIGIILPDGPFINAGLEDARQFLLDNVTPLAIVSLPRNIFRGEKSTTSKTTILMARKEPYKGETVLMAELDSLENLEQIREAFLSGQDNRTAFWIKNINSMSLHPASHRPERSQPAWRVPSAPLSRFIEQMFTGATRYGKERKFSRDGIPYTSAKAVTWLGVDFSRDGRFVRPGSPMDIRRAKTEVNDILFVRVGVGCSGRAAVVTDEKDAGIADDWIYVIRVRGVSPFYAAFFLATRDGQSQVESMKRGTGTVTIPQRLLKNIRIPIPSSGLQKKCEEFYNKMTALRRNGDPGGAKACFEQITSYIEKELNKSSC
ncbi:MAG: N-6 DNA methylase [Halobacteria archaeon]